MNNKSFYIVLIIDSEYIFEWQIAAIKNLLRNDKNKLHSVIINKNKQKTIGLEKVKGKLSKSLLMLNKCIVKHISKLPILRSNIGVFEDALKLNNIREFITSNYINLDDYIKERKFQAYDIDFIIDFSGLTSYEYLIDNVKHGIFSYLHGVTVDSNNPYSCAYYEALLNLKVTPFELKYYSRQDKDNIIVYREYLNTHILPACNTNNILWASVNVLEEHIEVFRKYSEEFYINSRINKYSDKDKIILSKINSLKLLVLNFKSFLRYLIKTIGDRLFYYQWFLLLVNNSDGKVLDKREKQVVILPEIDRFWADPSIIIYEDCIYIFIEEEVRSIKKGHISAIKLNYKGEVDEVAPIIVEGHHMSYPYIFIHDNEFYMIPESSQNNSIKLYKAEKFPYDWKEVKTIMKNVKGVDTSIVYFNGLWWMFMGKYSTDNSQNRKLYLYYSDNLFGDDWTSHPQNPIISDAREARNAGKIFVHEGNLYRPAQDCSKGYGYGIRIKKITELNKEQYKEEEVHKIEADMFTGIFGIHTINQDKDITVVDMLRRVPKFSRKRTRSLKYDNKDVSVINIKDKLV